MLHAVTRFEINQPLPRPNARAAFLFGEVRSAYDDIRQMASTQDFSRNSFLSRTGERRHIADSMRRLMRQIARVARFLPSTEYPGAKHKLQVPRSNGYSALLTRAAVFLETVSSIKAAFIERGMPPDFDLQLQALLAQFATASEHTVRARYTQVGSTAGMKARLREAVRSVRELDVILSLLFQDDAASYASWRSSSHIERAPRRSDKPQPSEATPESPSPLVTTLAAASPANQLPADSDSSPPPDPGDNSQLGLW